MSERLHQPTTAQFELRPEYDVHRNAGLYEPAFEGLEDVISLGATVPGLVSYEFNSGTVRRELRTFSFDDGEHDDDEVLFSDLSRVRLLRTFTTTEAVCSIEEYRTGPLRQLSRLAIHDYVADSVNPFVTEYHLERYVGGGIQALVSSTDVLSGHGIESRPMRPYDFRGLLYQIESVAMMMHLTESVEVTATGREEH